MNVRELIEALQQVPPDTRVVMISGIAEREIEQDIEYVIAGEIGGGIMQVELSGGEP